MVAETSDSTFEADVLNAGTPVLVDFYAPWCGPCKVIAPLLTELAKEKTDVKFLKLNVDENPHTAQTYGISGVPTLIYFNGGKPERTNVGAINRKDLEAFVN